MKGTHGQAFKNHSMDKIKVGNTVDITWLFEVLVYFTPVSTDGLPPASRFD